MFTKPVKHKPKVLCSFQLAIQLAVLIGKVARMDCPRQWPELLPSLIESITTVNDELRQQRVLLSFYQVIKGLSSKRLAHDRKVFEEVKHKLLGPADPYICPADVSQYDHLGTGNLVKLYHSLGIKQS